MIPVIETDAVIARLRLPTPVDQADRDLIEEAILDAQSDVEAYLGNIPITPRTFVEHGCTPSYGGNWVLKQAEWLDNIEVTSVAPETDASGALTGTYAVTYTAGLDARTDDSLRPLRRYVMAAAMNTPDVVSRWRTLTKQSGFIKSVSADGQSVSYETPTLGGDGKAGSPGALPNIATLSYWRVAGRRVHQGPSRTYIEVR